MITAFMLAGLVALAAIAIVLGLAARQPSTATYARSETIAAPPEAIYPLIADPKAFNSWSPFNEDPGIKGTYSGPPLGPGARYTFESRKAGTGYCEITEEQPPLSVIMRLVMTKPMACDNRVVFTLTPVAEGTRVTWAMTGPMTFVGKVINQVIDCERMCGKEFSRGLAKLKRIVEDTPQPASQRVA